MLADCGAAEMAGVEFFFDDGSPYSYLADTRLAGLAERTGAEIVYRPMLLGGVYRRQRSGSGIRGAQILQDLGNGLLHGIPGWSRGGAAHGAPGARPGRRTDCFSPMTSPKAIGCCIPKPTAPGPRSSSCGPGSKTGRQRLRPGVSIGSAKRSAMLVSVTSRNLNPFTLLRLEV